MLIGDDKDFTARKDDTEMEVSVKNKKKKLRNRKQREKIFVDQGVKNGHILCRLLRILQQEKWQK